MSSRSRQWTYHRKKGLPLHLCIQENLKNTIIQNFGWMHLQTVEVKMSYYDIYCFLPLFSAAVNTPQWKWPVFGLFFGRPSVQLIVEHLSGQQYSGGHASLISVNLGINCLNLGVCVFRLLNELGVKFSLYYNFSFWALVSPIVLMFWCSHLLMLHHSLNPPARYITSHQQLLIFTRAGSGLIRTITSNCCCSCFKYFVIN